MKHLLTLLLALFCSSVAIADPKTDAINNLLDAFATDDDAIKNLLAANAAFNDALTEAVMGNLVDDDLPQIGNSGPFIVEFSDYQCGYCKRMFPYLETKTDAGEAQLLVVEYPVLGQMSERAARYALIAKQQGRFSHFHRRMMTIGQLNEEKLREIAMAAGLDMEQLEANYDTPSIDEQLEKNYRLGSLLKIRGTPAFIVNNTIVRGALAEDKFNNLLQQQ